MSHDTDTIRPTTAYAAAASLDLLPTDIAVDPLRRLNPGGGSGRIRYAAGRASRSVSSWMPTAIFVRADECCRL